jgi:hypothetical protein
MGPKRSLRSVEDFTQFEQRTAYFNGDHVSAQRKGVNLPDRFDQVPMMAQMQNIIDFPPAPKLDPTGSLDPRKATQKELAGEAVLWGRGVAPNVTFRRQRSWKTTCTISSSSVFIGSVGQKTTCLSFPTVRSRH